MTPQHREAIFNLLQTVDGENEPLLRVALHCLLAATATDAHEGAEIRLLMLLGEYAIKENGR